MSVEGMKWTVVSSSSCKRYSFSCSSLGPELVPDFLCAGDKTAQYALGFVGRRSNVLLCCDNAVLVLLLADRLLVK